MTTSKRHSFMKFIGAFLLMMGFSFSANAQFLRTSYFMEGSHYRMQLNPALTPTRGYFNLPVLGSINATVSSTSLGYQDIVDIIDDNGDFYTNPKFLNRLNDNNHVNVNFGTEILSAGWYKGKNFWSINVGLRADIGAKLTKSMFTFLDDIEQDGDAWMNANYNIGGQQVNVNAFTEVGLGFARAINHRLTVGGKVKALLGIGNMELKINKAYMDANLPSESRMREFENLQITSMEQVERLRNEIGGYKAILAVDARLESSFKGLDLKEENGYISDIKFESKDMGIAGYGFGIDLGASYKVLDNLTVSASILDLGLISWSKGGTKVATASNNIDMKGQTYVDQLGRVTSIQEAQGIVNNFTKEAKGYLDRVGGSDVLNYDMLQLKESNVSESRSSSLASTFVVGAEYGLFNNKFAVGVLSTTRFIQPKSLTELTFSANYRPKNWFNLAVSYSALQSAGKSFGLGLKIGAFFVGTDYMFLGKNSNSVSGFLGVSFPLGGQKVCCKQ